MVVALAVLLARRAYLVHENEVKEQIVMASAGAILGYKGPVMNYAGAVDNVSLPVRDVLPRKPLREKFNNWGGSVAVVSSSPALVGTSLGALIDSHDIVMRFNYAPCKGYEEDVGRRTDIRALGRNHMFWEDERETAIHRYNFPEYVAPDLPLMAQLENPTTNRVYVFSNRFTDFLAELLGTNPTTGFVGVVFALREFKKVSIFGFAQMDLHRAAKKGTFHYYNTTANAYGPVMDFHRRYNLSDDWMWTMNEAQHEASAYTHDFPVEWDIYDRLERLGRLHRYEGKARQS